MKDIQNTKGDYGFKINKVGVTNVIHPILFKSKEGNRVATVGNFSMYVSLEKHLKGINMSRLMILLAELNENNWEIEHLSEDMKVFLEKMLEKMNSRDGYVELSFDFFAKKKAPISEYIGLMPYKCKIEASLHKNSEDEIACYDFILMVEVPITALCPCSKAISQYSAHNQRGYVQVSLRSPELIYIEEVIELVEAESSCEIYPILKRVDEKYVTEKAYENPRFVEDIVRLIAEKLNEDERITWFKVASRHQESIHPHDAAAEIEVEK
jgi:GTP cyclohydrolase IB